MRNSFLKLLAQNSSEDEVLKERGFQPRRKCSQINRGLAAEAIRVARKSFSAAC
jgi:hypothetical protein